MELYTGGKTNHKGDTVQMTMEFTKSVHGPSIFRVRYAEKIWGTSANPSIGNTHADVKRKYTRIPTS